MTINPQRLDPTRTTLLRKQLARTMTARIRSLKSDIIALLTEEDAFGLKIKLGVTANNRWRFETSAEKVAKFNEWLQEKINEKVIGPSRDNIDRFIRDGYVKGARRAYRGVRAKSNLFTSGEQQIGSEQEFFRLNRGDTERLKHIQGRTFRDLQGVTDAMAKQMTDVLSDGLLRGLPPEEIARNLNQRIDKIGINRATMIANDEVIRAHAEGALDVMEAMGEENITVSAEWRTAGDARVCPLCAPLEGQIIPIKKARGMFPRHPRCRCSPVPINEKADGRRLRKAINRSVKAELPKSLKKKSRTAKAARRRSRWVGSGR